MSHSHAKGWAALVCAMACGPGIALAQNSNDVNAGIQFDFAPSGARSLGIGGAFVAVADDVTSIYGNPAGLTGLTRLEFGAEFSFWDWRSRVVDHGHAFGNPSLNGIDTVPGVQRKWFDGSGEALSFAGLTRQIGTSWRVGGYYHVVTSYEVEREPQGAFFTCTGAIGARFGEPPFCYNALVDGVERDFPKRQSIDVKVRNYGGSAAYQRAPDSTWSIGFGLQVSTFSMDSLSKVFNASKDKKFQAANFTDPANIEIWSSQTGDDTGFAFNLGGLWRPNAFWQFGATFQRGASFTFTTRTETGPANEDGGGGVVADDVPTPFNVPDRYAAGLLFKPNANASNGFWQLSVEYNRVNYSELLDEFKDISYAEGDPESPFVMERLRIDDADQVRAGIEYLYSWRGRLQPQLVLRGGAFFDPQHQMYYQADDEATGLPTPLWSLLFMKAGDQLHKSFGVGFGIGKVTVDFAADFVDTGNRFVLSTVIKP